MNELSRMDTGKSEACIMMCLPPVRNRGKPACYNLKDWAEGGGTYGILLEGIRGCR